MQKHQGESRGDMTLNHMKRGEGRVERGGSGAAAKRVKAKKKKKQVTKMAWLYREESLEDGKS